MSQHPTGIAAFISTILIYVLAQVGVDLPPEVAAAVVGLAAVAVSAISPRVTNVTVESSDVALSDEARQNL